MMRGAAVTRADLCEAVHGALGLPKTDCSRVVDSVLDEISTALAGGETVKLSGFGTFTLRDKAQRTGRNPKSGDPVAIAPRRVLGFRPSAGLRARVGGA